MRFLFVNTHTTSKSIGGTEKSISEISKYLQSMGHEVFFFSLSDHKRRNGGSQTGVDPEGDHFLVTRYITNWVYKSRLGNTKFAHYWYHFFDLLSAKVFFKLLRVMRNCDPDYVVGHNLTGLSLSPVIACKIMKYQYIQILHDYNLICFKGTTWNKGASCKKACISCKPRVIMSKFIVNDVTVLGVSKFIVDKHQSFGIFSNSEIGVIHGNTNQKSVNRNLAVFDFGFMGQVNEIKGIQTFLDAAANSNYTFAVAGTATQVLQKKMMKLSNLRYLGWTSTDDFFEKIRCLIIPSIWDEPSCKLIYEAAWAGVPLILSDSPAMIENAVYHGVQFLEFKRGDVEQLMKAMRAISSSTQKPLGPMSRPPQGENLLRELNRMGYLIEF